MKLARYIMFPVMVMLFPLAFNTPSQAASQDDVLEKIRLLEIQIQQLKQLKEQQKFSDEKEQHCLKPLGDTKFCRCIAEALPQEVSFEQYVHFLVSTKEDLKYDTMLPEVRKAVDASITARDRCVGKGWFK